MLYVYMCYTMAWISNSGNNDQAWAAASGVREPRGRDSAAAEAGRETSQKTVKNTIIVR